MDEIKTQGAWIITRVYSAHGIQIDVKASGGNTAAAIDDLYAGIAHGIEKYGWQIEQTNAPKPVQVSAPAPATKTPAPKVEGDTAQINTMEIAKVKVEPQSDGKIKVGLFATGHQYADLWMNNLTLDSALKILANTGYEWTADYLSKVAEFDMHFFADWRNSEKLNTKGNPYKNVIALRSAEAAT